MTRALFLLVGGDVFITFLAQGFGVLVRFPVQQPLSFEVLPLGVRWLVFALVILLTTYLVELYSMDRRFNRKAIFTRVLVSLTLSLTILLALYWFFPQLGLDRQVVAFALLAFGLGQFAWHVRYPLLLRTHGVSKNILIVGVGALAEQIGRSLGGMTHNYVLAGYVQPPGEAVAVSSQNILATTERLFETAINHHIDKIVISISEKRGVLPISELLQCRFNGIEVVDAMSFHELTTGKLLVDQIKPDWLIYGDGFRITGLKCTAKRVFDICAALFGLVLVSPLFPLIAILIKADSQGPVIFSQERVGQFERLFRVYKFRTMCVNAEQETGAVWAKENDSRITRVGSFLRKTRLDELPQLVNVLKGDMALVGPRPERPEFVKILNEKVPYYARRHLVKPGLTGWAQVRFSYGASVEDSLEKLKYDLYYMKHFTPMMDLLIILETVKVVLFGRGGR